MDNKEIAKLIREAAGNADKMRAIADQLDPKFTAGKIYVTLDRNIRFSDGMSLLVMRCDGILEPSSDAISGEATDQDLRFYLEICPGSAVGVFRALAKTLK
jgi:hypothetical protein